MNTNAIKFLAFVAVVGAMLSAGDARAAGKYLNQGIAIRGIGQNAHCDAETLVPYDNRTALGRASNLSVNCTEDTNTISNYQHYLQDLPHNRYRVGKIAAIASRQGTVKTQPTDANPYHCVVNGITPKDLAKSIGSCRVTVGTC